MTARILFLFAAITIPESVCASTLKIHARDESGHPIWARLEVRGRGGKMYHPAKAIIDLTAGSPEALPFYQGSFVIYGDCQLQVPPGHYRIIGAHGPEYELVERSVEVSDGGVTTAALRIRPWICMRKLGWWSGDLHVHWPPAEARVLALAEDLNFCPVITTWGHQGNRQFWLSNVWGFGSTSVIEVDTRHFVALRNVEDERGGGAWIFLMLRKPLQGWGAVAQWYPLGLKFAYEAREQRGSNSLYPWFDCEKPFWWEVPVMMALSTPDSLELLSNKFMEYGIEDYEPAGRAHTRNQREFPGREGWVNYMLDLYYRYLNLGFHLPASAGSASGVFPNPVGYNRVYVRFSGPFSVSKWFTALHEGKSFVTNGPMLFFNVVRDGSAIRGTVEACSREPLDRIEIVANGKIIHWFPVPPGTLRYKADFVFDPTDYSWVAARCFLRSGVTIRLAHTSPVYLKGHWDCRPDAQYFINWMNNLINQTKADPKRFSSQAEQGQVLKIYGQALGFYEQKAQRGCPAK